MSRKRYLVCYDITDDKRRTKVFKTLVGYGDHTQFSVFLCHLNDIELTKLKCQLENAIHHREDQVLFAYLGNSERDMADHVNTIGKGLQKYQKTQIF